MEVKMLFTKSGKEVSKIGIGTWTINKENIDDEVKALQFYYNQGINYIDVVLAYDNGAVLDVVEKFLKTIKREDIFINAFITHGCAKITDVERQIETYMDKLNIDYFDCVTLHSPVVLGFDFNDYVKEIQHLKSKYKIFNIGYSNLSPEQYKQVREHISFFEGLYNLENKINDDNGIINACKQDNIPFYAYQPLRRNRTAKQNYKEVVSLANKYSKTQNQIIINWLVKHKNIGILIKSSKKEHIKENIDALDFEMKEKDYLLLDKFRNKEFDKIPFSYFNEEGKIRIDQIPNQPIGNL